jgi:RNA polymerase sigma factor (sigma-70 family)
LPAGNPDASCGDEKKAEPSDANLWARSRAGNTEAFGRLFQRHAKIIYNYCFRRVGDWVAAEDLLSIVFLEAWRRRDTQLEGDKVVPWLYGIATNVVRNQRRSERRFAAALRRVPPAQPEADFADIAHARVDDELQMRAAVSLLRQLPQQEQDVFVLCAWMDLSYDDAALALGVPVGTVRSRLSRARRRLRELKAAFEREQAESTEEAPRS